MSYSKGTCVVFAPVFVYMKQYRNIKDLQLAGEQWVEVLQKHTGVCYPFLCYHWFLKQVKYFYERKQVRLFCCGDERGSLIAPLHKHGMIYKGIKSSFSDYFDFLFSGQYCLQALHTFIVAMGKANFSFDGLRDDAVLLKNIKKLNQRGDLDGYIVTIKKTGKAPYLRLGTDWSIYYPSLKTKFRKDLERRIKKIKKLGELQFRICSSLSEIKTIFPRLIEQHVHRRDYLGQDRSVFVQERTIKFFNELFCNHDFAEDIRLFYLCLDDKVIGTVLAFYKDNILYHYIPTFDVAYHEYSPGRILNSYIIKYCYEHNIQELDFMIGDEPYKLEWGTDFREIFKISLFRKNLMGYLLLMIDNCAGILKFSRHYLEQTKLKDCKRYFNKAIRAHIF